MYKDRKNTKTVRVTKHSNHSKKKSIGQNSHTPSKTYTNTKNTNAVRVTKHNYARSKVLGPNNYTPSKNPWENETTSFLNIPKERRHMRFGGLKKLMENNGILEENPPDQLTNVDKQAEEFLKVMDGISKEREKHTQLEQEIKEHVAKELSLETVQNRIKTVDSLNEYFSKILLNKDKIESVITKINEKAMAEELESQNETKKSLIIGTEHYKDFCKYVVQMNKLLKSPATDLENIRWAQDSRNVKKAWSAVESRIDSLIDQANRNKKTNK
eukprot:g8633.t1